MKRREWDRNGGKSMKILIIGNGFDLAHGLPTRYLDFLEFAQRASAIYTFASDAKSSRL